MKKLFVSTLLIFTIPTSQSFAQMECTGIKCVQGFTLLSKEIISGSFDCDHKGVQNVCKEIIEVKLLGQISSVESTIFCKPLPSGQCPEVKDCISNQLKQIPDPDFEAAFKILKKKNITAQNLTSTQKLTKEEARTVSIAINKLDVKLLKDMPAKDIAQIEEFKSLPLDKQSAILIKPKGNLMAGLVAAGAVAATAALYQGLKAAADSMFGGDHLKSLNGKKTTDDDKEFDLKN
jgi:hypothetical protein